MLTPQNVWQHAAPGRNHGSTDYMPQFYSSDDHCIFCIIENVLCYIKQYTSLVLSCMPIEPALDILIF